ncbi:MAG TPA: hypothetical protein VEL11_08180 [Candidatus Bathyarchaeia archaeon]|nr:hypothetical protein [Candidatus Bathyarchaeia archaeon]
MGAEERGPSQDTYGYDIKSKSKFTQAKLFSELKSPVEVVIALDLPANKYLDLIKLNWNYVAAVQYAVRSQ